MSAPSGPGRDLGACRSTIHAERGEGRVAATHVGVFDCSVLNGAAPQPGSTYCLRCAALLLEVGYFTPDEGQVPVPSLHALYAEDSSPASA